MTEDYSHETQYTIIDARFVNDGEFVFQETKMPYESFDFMACSYEKNYCLSFNIIEGKEELMLNGIINGEMIGGHIDIPENIEGYLVTEICDGAIEENFRLESITIPSSVKVIGSNAFAFCRLTEINIPDSVREIGCGIFNGCVGLSNVKISSSIRKIPMGAFKGTGIEEIYIPASVEKIEGEAFIDCYNLKCIHVDENNPIYDSRNNCNAIIDTAHNALVVGCASTVIPDTVSEIWKCGILNIRNVFIPESVTYISELVPYVCKNVESICVDENNPVYDSRGKCNAIIETLSNKLVLASNLTEIPDSVTEIGFSSFCAANVERLVIPSLVSKIDGETAFFNSHNISSIIVDEDNLVYDSRCNCNAIVEKVTNKLLLGCCNTIIPDSVLVIGKRSFRSRTGLERIEIPISVKKIEEEAFDECKNLKYVILYDSEIDAHLTSFPYGSIFNIKLIRDTYELIFRFETGSLYLTGYKVNDILNKPSKLNIPSKVANIMVTRIGDNVFFSNTHLEEICIPDTIVSIGKYAFSDCKCIKNIFIPSSVMEIDSTSFADNHLQTINVDEDNQLFETLENDTVVIKVYPLDYDERDFVVERKIVVRCNDVYDKDDYYDEFSLLKSSCIYSGHMFTHQLDVKSNYNEELLKSLIDNFSVTFIKVVKYIHVYDNNSMINIYIDFTQGIVTDDIRKLKDNKDNIVFKDKSLTNLTIDNYTFYRCSVVEYSNSPYNILSDLDNNKVVYRNDGKYDFSNLLKEEIMRVRKKTNLQDLQWNKGYNDICMELLDGMEPSITNCFYIESMGCPSHSKPYKLYANIAVDSTFVDKKESIMSFVAEFKQFLDIVYNQILNNNRLISALESAVSHVFNRNLAHNYNSHLLSNLNDRNVYAKMNDETIKANLRSFSGDDDKVFEVGKNMQLYYFMQYLGARMDYINEIAYAKSSMFFEKMVYKDLVFGLDKTRILLNYISGISGFKYKFDVKYNGQPLSDENDIAVDMPSDTLGMQAFYNIIENIIRNTAKHSVNKSYETTIGINFSDIEENPDYYCVEIDNGIQENDVPEIVAKLNACINESILDDNYTLRQRNLGIIEMMVGALFLRGLDIVNIASKEYKFVPKNNYENDYGNLIVFKAIVKNSTLGYRFFIRKPRKILLVGDWTFNKNEVYLSNLGIQIVKEKDFTKKLKECEVFTHQFVLYKQDAKESTKNILMGNGISKTLLPLRKVVLRDNGERLTDIINGNSNIDLLNKLTAYSWEKYYEDKLDISKVYIGDVLNIDKAQDYQTQIVFLNHANERQFNFAKNCLSVDYPDVNVFVENLSSYARKKLPDLNRDYAKYAIYEAYSNKIIVLDERIQSFANNNTEGSGKPISCSQLLRSTDVLIPDISLAPNEFDNSIIEKVESFVESNIKDSFILVHYGILERIYKTEEKINEKLKNWSQMSRKVVVTSGRGSHSLELPKYVCFVNLSSILSVFTEHRNKYQINYLINQSRRKK